MPFTLLDWSAIVGYLAITLVMGVVSAALGPQRGRLLCLRPQRELVAGRHLGGAGLHHLGMASGAADRRGHGHRVHLALVLVAHQRLERDLGDGVLAARAGGAESLAAVRWQQFAGVRQGGVGNDGRDHDCVADGDTTDQARAGRSSTAVLSACSTGCTQMEAGRVAGAAGSNLLA